MSKSTIVKINKLIYESREEAMVGESKNESKSREAARVGGQARASKSKRGRERG